MADVSGKGIAASLLMAICRTNLRQIAPRHATPAAALCELNRALGREIGAGLYITMLYAIIDVARHEVTFARAGHELPLLVRPYPARGVPRLEFLASEGMALGMVADDLFGSTLAERTVPFVPGDLLVLYTDGITEAPNEEGKEFSGARLVDVLRTHSHHPAREINAGIIAAVERFVGEAPQRDDFSLVTVKRVEPRGEAARKEQTPKNR